MVNLGTSLDFHTTSKKSFDLITNYRIPYLPMHKKQCLDTELGPLDWVGEAGKQGCTVTPLHGSGGVKCQW